MELPSCASFFVSYRHASMQMHSLLWLFCMILTCHLVHTSSFFSSGSSRFSSSSPSSPPDTAYYDILGLSPSASEQDIKTAYRSMAKKMHPDKGGNTEQFKQLQEAYDTLRDSSRREVYDRCGKEGLTAGDLSSAARSSDFSGDLRDLFRSFASDFQRSVPLLYQLELPLEDFFQGRSLTLELQGERFSLSVEAGMMEGLEIRGRLASGREVVFALRERAHAIFQRRQADLLLQLNLSIYEALFGFERGV
ncbi:hypothetical protein EON64_19640, partial [archaeon]